jgi:hypothetical protein
VADQVDACHPSLLPVARACSASPNGTRSRPHRSTNSPRRVKRSAQPNAGRGPRLEAVSEVVSPPAPFVRGGSAPSMRPRRARLLLPWESSGLEARSRCSSNAEAPESGSDALARGRGSAFRWSPLHRALQSGGSSGNTVVWVASEGASLHERCPQGTGRGHEREAPAADKRERRRGCHLPV